jgi:hypothetical protein
MVKKLLLSGLAAIVIGLTPNCDNGGDNGYECIANEECATNEQCVEGYCEEQQEPECGIRETFEGCEDLGGIYQVLNSTCSNKYGEIHIWMGFDEDKDDVFCTHSSIGAIDKKSGELDCLKGACGDGYEITGNVVESSKGEHTFIKCDDQLMKMYWGLDCEAWLEKSGPESTTYKCNCN